MRISKLTLMGIVLLVSLTCAGVVSACEYGCSPGYWKNHDWPAGTIPFPANIDLNNDGAWDTPIDALNYQGGPGVEGAQRIFLKAYVAGYLNYLSGFGVSSVALFDGTYNSQNRQVLITKAGILDHWNNIGCPWD